MVEDLAMHGLSWCFGEGQHPCHTAVNCIIERAFTSAKVPSWLEPTGLYSADGKCSILPWMDWSEQLIKSGEAFSQWLLH